MLHCVVQAGLKFSFLASASWVLGFQVCPQLLCLAVILYSSVYLCCLLEIPVVRNLVGYVGTVGFYLDWRIISLSSEGKQTHRLYNSTVIEEIS